MALPYFFVADLGNDRIVLDEDTSRHMIGVLRMQKGEELFLTNGRGIKAIAIIEDDHRKRSVVSILGKEEEPELMPRVCIGISLVKNASRFEWFLEKATEMGVSEIIPLICERTEKEKFRMDRMHQILVSAMLQSQQCRMPVLQEPLPVASVIQTHKARQKFIAHCLPDQKIQLNSKLISNSGDQLMLIGPEGDFTPAEIELALKNEFKPVSLGPNRLRTETAGLVAACLMTFTRELKEDS